MGKGAKKALRRSSELDAGAAAATASKLRLQVVRTVSGYSPTTGPISSSNFSRKVW